MKEFEKQRNKEKANKIKLFVAKIADKMLLKKKFATGFFYSTDI